VATRAHTSGRETARSTAQIPASMGGGEEAGGAIVMREVGLEVRARRVGHTLVDVVALSRHETGGQ
jgi:hypothetical protein